MNAQLTLADLKPDIAAVQRELSVFRTEYIPVFLQPVEEDEVQDAMTDKLEYQRIEIDMPESDWLDAIDRLDAALPLTPVPPARAELRIDFFRDFMAQESTPGYLMRDGRMVWDIALAMVRPDTRFICRGYRSDGGNVELSLEQLQAELPRVRKWLMGLPIDEPYLWNTLITHLPALADADPAFTKFVLDVETWQSIVRSDRTLTGITRAQKLQRVEAQMQRVMNTVLLHVIGSLANNHFFDIRDFLPHPFLKGPSTNLMPHFVFAVLYQKVNTLRKFCTL